MNHLKNEKSPYLLQHADNPVDWYPWCDAAFDEARRRDVPIFLSIGYSVCHWCHVMAHESFEDQETAEVLRRGFVSVKVDREERPDIDSVYMSACHAMTGSGGWPLTIIMTPGKEPFFAATYLPKPQLTALLQSVSHAWQSDRQQLLNQSALVTEFLKDQDALSKGVSHGVDANVTIAAAVRGFVQSFDRRYGGFGRAPKFPSAHNLLFLLSQGQSAPAEKTLLQMYRGGIFDHIGGGFCRYSTDAQWLVPHFEKMLYDNALLLAAYAEAAASGGNPLFSEIADRIFTWVTREMTCENGGFYCSQDADAEGREGSFYVFTPREAADVLGPRRGQAFCEKYDITASGNFEGRSIPNLLQAEDLSMAEEEDLLPLYQYRAGRMALHKDDKILTSWNGLMIAALARSARRLGRRAWLDAAFAAADFLWNEMADGSGRLLARWRDGEAGITGTLDDYAFYAWGLLECYRANFDAKWLQRAVLVGEQLQAQFFDEKRGGCYLYAADGEQLFLRPKETYDGAMPSGNAAAALVFTQLEALTAQERFRDASEKQQAFMVAAAAQAPAGSSFFLWQLAEAETRRGQLVITVGEDAAAVLPSAEALWPLNLDILVKKQENSAQLAAAAPFTADYPLPETGVKYYLCRSHRCYPAADSLDAVIELLR